MDRSKYTRARSKYTSRFQYFGPKRVEVYAKLDELSLNHLRTAISHLVSPMASSLLSLYQSILVPILSEWICDEDLCCVDTAACSRSLRNSVLMTLSKCSIFHTLPKRETHRERNQWILLRGIKLLTLKFNGLFDGPLLRAGSYVDSIEMCAIPELFFLLSDMNIRTKKLKVIIADYPHADLFDPNLCCSWAVSKCVQILAAFPELESVCLDLKHKLRSVRNVEVCVSNSVSIMTALELYSHRTDHEMQLLLPHMKTLQVISIDDFYIDQWRSLLLTCCNLTALYLDFNDFHRCFVLSLLGNCNQLRRLNFCVHATDNLSVRDIAEYCRRLESCTLHGVISTEEEVRDCLAMCVNLINLNVNMKFSNSTASLLPEDIESLALGEHTSPYFEMMGKSLTIDASFSQRTDWRWYSAVFTRCCKLLSVKLTHCTKINNRVICDLIQYCPLLTSVHIRSCVNVTQNALPDLGRCQHLASLEFCYQQVLDNSVASKLLSTKSNLVKLSLAYTKAKGSLLAIIVQHCSSVKHVDLARNRDVTSSDVIVLLKGCLRLNYLNLNWCSQVGMQIFAHIKLQKWRYLNVRGCNISYEFVSDFVKATGLACSVALMY